MMGEILYWATRRHPEHIRWLGWLGIAHPLRHRLEGDIFCFSFAVADPGLGSFLSARPITVTSQNGGSLLHVFHVSDEAYALPHSPEEVTLALLNAAVVRQALIDQGRTIEQTEAIILWANRGRSTFRPGVRVCQQMLADTFKYMRAQRCARVDTQDLVPRLVQADTLLFEFQRNDRFITTAFA
jgi:hypothetical protein